MNDMNRSTLMLDELTELAEEKQAHTALLTPAVVLPTLISVLADVSPLPDESIFLGLAEDGLPVLLNLNDSIPGPILIVGDQASGKTAYLKMIARAAELQHSAPKIQCGIITQYPEEWAGFQENQVIAGIYATENSSTGEFIQSIFDWAHNNKGNEQSILLLIDGLEGLKDLEPQTEQNLRWLLLRGPSRRVWPIITANSQNVKNAESWLTFFHTRLFGRIQNAWDSKFIAGFASEPINDLTAGSQFAMRKGDKWLKFLLPSIE